MSLRTTTDKTLPDMLSTLTVTLNSSMPVQCKLSEGNAIHAVGTFIALIIIVENALVLTAIAMKRKVFGMVFFVFVQSLAISDLLSGVIFFYTFLFNDLLSLDDVSVISWTLRKSSIIASLLISVGSLELISVDRFISVAWPLRHDKLMTRRRAIQLVVFVWVSGMIFIIAPTAGWNCDDHCVCLTATVDGTPNCPGAHCSRIYPPLTDAYIITVVCLFLLLTIGICFCNGAVYWKVKLHFARMARTRTCTSMKRDEKELAAFMTLVFVIFMLCWLPAVIMLTIDSVTTEAHISDEAFDLCSMPALFNSLINPWLYAIKLRKCRRVLVNWLCKCVDKPRRYEIFKISRSIVPAHASGSASARTQVTRCARSRHNTVCSTPLTTPTEERLRIFNEEEEALNYATQQPTITVRSNLTGKSGTD